MSKPNSKFESGYVGTERDFQFLTDLANKYPTLLDSLSDWKSDMGVGFEKNPEERATRNKVNEAFTFKYLKSIIHPKKMVMI